MRSLALWLLLAGLVWAQPELTGLDVRVDRPDAQVYVVLGQGQKELSRGGLSRAQTRALNDSLHLVIEAPDFQKLEVNEPYDAANIDRDGVYHWPPAGQPPLAMIPAGPMGWLKKFWYVFAALALLVAAISSYGLVVRGRARQVDARQKALEARIARSTDRDALHNTLLMGRFRILSKLGSGGMATVYEGILDDAPEETVAIKLMRDDLAEDPEFRQRFQREFKLAARLSHPSIVRVIELGEQDKLYFIVMEFVQGRTLKSVLEERPSDVMRFFRPIAEAVQYAHSQGVVHRDLKTDNVMVLDSGRVKVMDFGLARTHDGTKITQTGTAMGTPAYMAPEQITTGLADARSDQYSLGVMLYEMLCGQKPFEAPDIMALAMKHLNEAVPVPADQPLGVQRVLLRMLAKDSARRYPDLPAVLAALEAALAGDPREQDVVEATVAGPQRAAQTPVIPVESDDTIGFSTPGS